MLAYLRRYEGQTLLSVNNLSATPQSVSLDLAAWAGIRPLDLLSEEEMPPLASGNLQLELARYEYRWLRL